MGRASFTLVEVLAATALLAIALVGIAQSHGGTIKSALRSEAMSQAAALAQEKMTELELEIRKRNFDSMSDEEKGDFKNEKLKNFHWLRKLEKVDVGCFLPSDTDDDAKQNNQSLIGIAKNFFEKNIRKATITVDWLDGTKKKSVDLVQLVVQFENIPTVQNSQQQQAPGNQPPSPQGQPPEGLDPLPPEAPQ